MIDGLKPVQRRILWTIYSSPIREHFTKTVKVAGMVMAYHPHGNASIEDAISQMVQDFPFTNNYPLISGSGTFGDILDAKAIASPRYTEVKISAFAKDIGLFESTPDIDYESNYDETSKEPIYFVPKIPLILLNSVRGIATGFRSNIMSHKLSDVVDAMTQALKKKSIPPISPWYKGFKGYQNYQKNEEGQFFLNTGFGFSQENHQWFLTDAPQGWNREKTITYLDELMKEKEEIRNYLDLSKDRFKIQLIFKRGEKITQPKLQQLFNKVNKEMVEQNVINSQGKLKKMSTEEVIKEFCNIRKIHLIKRFQRLAGVEKEKIDKLNELIRFIKEKWNQKVVSIKSKKMLEENLKEHQFRHYEWLSEIPIYRLTAEEVNKCLKGIDEAKKKLKEFTMLCEKDRKLVEFIIEEIQMLKKWDHE
ncbi:DNA gyrase subunit A-like [Ylistrum balloti]|uniref:DNA gyrase subunit A-like n=1 Tax=Ylistrum balloti TaxID=509963 RepID=UPI002905C8DA|nr:DNA gyrase subunit A-like [Ylistrum balloti]